MADKQLDQHHIKYKEIHGVDEIIMLSHSEHVKLHSRLRREGKCKIPPAVLDSISKKAHGRTPRGKAAQKKRSQKYYQLNKNRLHKNRLNQSQYIIRQMELENRAIEKNTRIRESISYNYNTGTVTCTTRFTCSGGFKLPVVELL